MVENIGYYESNNNRIILNNARLSKQNLQVNGDVDCANIVNSLFACDEAKKQLDLKIAKIYQTEFTSTNSNIVDKNNAQSEIVFSRLKQVKDVYEQMAEAINFCNSDVLEAFKIFAKKLDSHLKKEQIHPFSDFEDNSLEQRVDYECQFKDGSEHDLKYGRIIPGFVIPFFGGVELGELIRGLSFSLVSMERSLEVYLIMGDLFKVVTEKLSDHLTEIQTALSDVRSDGKDDATRRINEYDDLEGILSDSNYILIEDAGYTVDANGHPIDPVTLEYIWDIVGAVDPEEADLMAICDRVNDVDVTKRPANDELLASEWEIYVSQIEAHIQGVQNESSQLLKQMESTTLTQYQSIIDAMKEAVSEFTNVMSQAASKI